MSDSPKVNILLVDDQPAKLLSYEVILQELNETLVRAGSAREALGHLLKTEFAVVLMDVQMPELDGFELAAMIREHPRFQKIAIIFISAIHLTDLDRLRGYEAGAVDYLPVPVVPEVLRAKVRVFVDLYRKTRQLEVLNEDLERRVSERTADLEASAARLRESEQRRSLALAAGQMGSWDYDVQADELLWDEGQHRIFGLSPGRTLKSGDIGRFVHPEDRDNYDAALLAAIDGRKEYRAEFRIVQPSGEVRWCVATGVASTNPGNRVVRLSGVTHDVTVRKNAEEALARQNEELERRVEEGTRQREHALAQLFEAQKMDTIGQFTGGVAHDFNNLLMAVLGSLELLKKHVPQDPRAIRLLTNAMEGAQRGASLTKRLLAFARRQELKPEVINLVALMGGLDDLLRRALGPGIELSIDVPENVPLVRVDANQLELALLNIAINARDAMPGGGSLCLFAHTKNLDEKNITSDLMPGLYVQICAVDTGIGMDSETLEKATEPFFTTKGPGKGTGLGLSMVHGLAGQSGGTLKISSTPGIGTRIELWLPAASEGTTAAIKSKDLPVTPTSRSLKILVVDDDLLVSSSTAAMIDDLGHSVLEATSGEMALQILDKETSIDLVITDHAMPSMTGLELIQAIQRKYPGKPVILASGFAEVFLAAELASPPRLNKPFTQEQLAIAIASAVREVQRPKLRVVS